MLVLRVGVDSALSACLAPTHPMPHIPIMPPTISLQHVEVHPGSSTERLPALGGRAAF